MTNLKKVLADACQIGLVAPADVEALERFLTNQNVAFQGVKRATDHAKTDAVSRTDAGLRIDSETPRFVRGFHDILITLGILVLLAGVAWLIAAIVVLPAIVILSEKYVRQRRLALPAVALSLALMVWTLSMGILVLEPKAFDAKVAVQICLPLPVVLGLYFWRFRVPLSLALSLTSLVALVLAVLFYALDEGAGMSSLAERRPVLWAGLLLTAAFALFAVALWFDLADPYRQTPRSDVAFWLHLVSAPALLCSLLSLAAFGKIHRLFESVEGGLLAVLVVMMLCLIGVALDRRAFVTSGVVALCVAIAQILNGSSAVDHSIAWALSTLLVGLFVLIVGTYWETLRIALLARLPRSIGTKLPPLR